MKGETMPLIAFMQKRVNQYAERKGFTSAQATERIMALWGREGNQQAVNDEIDAIVDEEFRSANAPGHK